MAASQPFRIPPKPRTSSTGLTIGILILLTLLVGGGMVIHSLMQRQQRPEPSSPSVKKRPEVKLATSDPLVNVFSTATTQPSYPFPSNDHNEDGQNPIYGDGKVEFTQNQVDWDKVQETYRTATPEMAVLALSD